MYISRYTSHYINRTCHGPRQDVILEYGSPSGVKWATTPNLVPFKEQAHPSPLATPRSNSDNSDKVFLLPLLMWDCGCAMRTERPQRDTSIGLGPLRACQLRSRGASARWSKIQKFVSIRNGGRKKNSQTHYLIGFQCVMPSCISCRMSSLTHWYKMVSLRLFPTGLTTTPELLPASDYCVMFQLMLRSDHCLKKYPRQLLRSGADGQTPPTFESTQGPPPTQQDQNHLGLVQTEEGVSDEPLQGWSPPAPPPINLSPHPSIHHLILGSSIACHHLPASFSPREFILPMEGHERKFTCILPEQDVSTTNDKFLRLLKA